MYTVEIYKADKRKKSGERQVLKQDYDTDNLSMLEHTVKHTWLKRDGYRYEIHKTFVTKTNLMSGQEFQERYDRPYYCSPSSETYWSM
jgi:hypothetical protein